ncbi:MAG: TonB-dependent receptor [Bacteroidetes bacterium]|nr:TonB-dependent receptor [Bacteroidota bacterium]
MRHSTSPTTSAASGPAGGGIPLTDNNMKFKSEKLDAYEVGFVVELFNGKAARLNTSAFYFADYHVTTSGFFQIVGLTTFITNADARSHGVEAEFQASPIEGLDFLPGAAYSM